MLPDQFLLSENTRLRKENEDLHEQVYFWKSQIVSEFEPPIAWGLTPTQVTMFRMLLTRPLVSREAFLTVIYSGRDEPLSSKIIDVWISRMRAQIAPSITIKTAYGRGWYLDEKTRKHVKDKYK